ncbi:head GIN domain-containing protein [Pelomonas sp. SE-A7]|uniref:head GIN domain-containing protein n=1 Tax=Pelomonas sp. SE-A7 TaxID=3054953 RepID=UPI00259C7807|nr:head GIN domain-containing protein [Pelomonas sp. SE-A7]MDM4768219.1 head GIN domain-containing protein [Pelomonas sp. SE-A7]
MPRIRHVLALPFALLLATQAATAGNDNDWRLRIKKDVNGWSASLSGPSEYGPSNRRTKGSGHVVEKARAIAPFTKLRLEGPIDVRLNQAGSESLKITADDNIEPLIESKVEGDTLVLRVQQGAGYSTRHSPVAWLDFKQLQALTISGSGDATLDRLKGDSLALTLSGSGDLRIGLLEVKQLSATLSGSGDLSLAGKADQQTWALHGSGDVDARSLVGNSCKAQLSGSGDLELGVVELLDVSLSGSGDLSYAGRPKLTQRVSGSGEVSAR